MRVGIDRRAPDLSRGGIARAGRRRRARRAARAHRRRVLRRHRRLAIPSRNWRRCWTFRCWATATSGRPTTRCDMLRETGCAGVVVGRGCLGRPWLFGDLGAAFEGRPRRGCVPASARSPASCDGTPSCWPSGSARSAASPTSASTSPGISRDSPSARSLRSAMAQASSLAELDDLLGATRPGQPFPESVVGQPRGRTSGARPVTLPDGLARRPHQPGGAVRRGVREQRRLTRRQPDPVAEEMASLMAGPTLSSKDGSPLPYSAMTCRRIGNDELPLDCV